MLKKFLNITLSLAILSLPILFFWQRTNLFDWWKLRDYVPNAQVAKLAADTTMNNYGKRLFYVNDPKIDPKTTFNEHCSFSEQTIVLGCYVNIKGIYLLDVTDKRLDGIHEVTAAHEMLHAAYERLNSKEKISINKLIEEQFAKVKDERLLRTVEQYRQRDATIVDNELHSILGTELRDLSPALELYYSKYFTNRLKVVEYSEKYEGVFDAIKKQVADYDAQLTSLKSEIDSYEKQIDSLGGDLEKQRLSLDSLLAQNKTAEYNRGVPIFNTQVKNYNSLVVTVKSKVDLYNNLVEQRNSVASEQKVLIQAIDSRTITTKSKD